MLDGLLRLNAIASTALGAADHRCEGYVESARNRPTAGRFAAAARAGEARPRRACSPPTTGSLRTDRAHHRPACGGRSMPGRARSSPERQFRPVPAAGGKIARRGPDARTAARHRKTMPKRRALNSARRRREAWSGDLPFSHHHCGEGGRGVGFASFDTMVPQTRPDPHPDPPHKGGGRRGRCAGHNQPPLVAALPTDAGVARTASAMDPPRCPRGALGRTRRAQARCVLGRGARHLPRATAAKWPACCGGSMMVQWCRGRLPLHMFNRERHALGSQTPLGGRARSSMRKTTSGRGISGARCEFFRSRGLPRRSRYFSSGSTRSCATLHRARISHTLATEAETGANPDGTPTARLPLRIVFNAELGCPPWRPARGPAPFLQEHKRRDIRTL